MSEKKKAEAETIQNEETEKKAGTVVYCGPSIAGVAKQFTVYHNGIPAELQGLVKKCPAAAALIVPIEKFAQTRAKLETRDSAESIIYQKIKTLV